MPSTEDSGKSLGSVLIVTRESRWGVLCSVFIINALQDIWPPSVTSVLCVTHSAIQAVNPQSLSNKGFDTLSSFQEGISKEAMEYL